jgi:hypothetical protein
MLLPLAVCLPRTIPDHFFLLISTTMILLVSALFPCFHGHFDAGSPFFENSSYAVFKDLFSVGTSLSIFHSRFLIPQQKVSDAPMM